MRFAHAFWSKPLTQKKFFDIKEAIEITLYEYALSVEMIHKHHHKITLYTDELGARILGVIPYDNVVILENTITDNYHFAASIKFEALKRMDIKDTLIDGDIFLHKKTVYEIIRDSTCDVLVSFFENKGYIDNCRERNEKMFDILKDKELTFPPENYDDLDGWYNTSTMHFNSQELKDAYIAQYIENIKRLDNGDYGNTWPDLIIEQRNLFRLCQQMDKKIDVIVDDFPSPESNQYSIEIGLLHVGSAKRQHQPVVVRDLMTVNKPLAKKIDHHISWMTKKLTEG